MIALEKAIRGSADYRVLDGVQVSVLEHGVPVRRVKLLSRHDSMAADYMGNEKKLIVRRKEGLASINCGHVVSVHYSHHMLIISMADGRQIETRALQESFNKVVESAFADPRFVKPHESYLVNMDYVAGFTSKQFEMVDGTEIPISKRVYMEVKKKYLDYVVENYDAVLV